MPPHPPSALVFRLPIGYQQLIEAFGGFAAKCSSRQKQFAANWIRGKSSSLQNPARGDFFRGRVAFAVIFVRGRSCSRQNPVRGIFFAADVHSRQIQFAANSVRGKSGSRQKRPFL